MTIGFGVNYEPRCVVFTPSLAWADHACEGCLDGRPCGTDHGWSLQLTFLWWTVAMWVRPDEDEDEDEDEHEHDG